MNPPGAGEQAGGRSGAGGAVAPWTDRPGGALVPPPVPVPVPELELELDGPTLREVERLAGGAGQEAVRALGGLLAGNLRFCTGRAEHAHQDAARLREVARGQHPAAMVLSCSDSRVPVEILLDQGIGDLFGQRVAGNVLDSMVLGSIEYAAEHLGVPLLVVLGHSSCGAVAATVEAVRTGSAVPGHIGAIVTAIRPAVEGVVDAEGFGDAAVRRAEQANVRHVVEQVSAGSEIVRELVHRGRLAVVGAFYDLSTGRVSLLP